MLIVLGHYINDMQRVLLHNMHVTDYHKLNAVKERVASWITNGRIVAGWQKCNNKDMNILQAYQTMFLFQLS